MSFVRRTYLQLGIADEGRGTRNAEKDALVRAEPGPALGNRRMNLVNRCVRVHLYLSVEGLIIDKDGNAVSDWAVLT
ncbi:MAG: hypothetical protein WBF57_22185 [Mycobacterium sp.]